MSLNDADFVTLPPTLNPLEGKRHQVFPRGTTSLKNSRTPAGNRSFQEHLGPMVNVFSAYLSDQLDRRGPADAGASQVSSWSSGLASKTPQVQSAAVVTDCRAYFAISHSAPIMETTA